MTWASAATMFVYFPMIKLKCVIFRPRFGLKPQFSRGKTTKQRLHDKFSLIKSRFPVLFQQPFLLGFIFLVFSRWKSGFKTDRPKKKNKYKITAIYQKGPIIPSPPNLAPLFRLSVTHEMKLTTFGKYPLSVIPNPHLSQTTSFFFLIRKRRNRTEKKESENMCCVMSSFGGAATFATRQYDELKRTQPKRKKKLLIIIYWVK